MASPTVTRRNIRMVLVATKSNAIQEITRLLSHENSSEMTGAQRVEKIRLYDCLYQWCIGVEQLVATIDNVSIMEPSLHAFVLGLYSEVS
jgi:hypothetical protein